LKIDETLTVLKVVNRNDFWNYFISTVAAACFKFTSSSEELYEVGSYKSTSKTTKSRISTLFMLFIP